MRHIRSGGPGLNAMLQSVSPTFRSGKILATVWSVFANSEKSKLIVMPPGKLNAPGFKDLFN